MTTVHITGSNKSDAVTSTVDSFIANLPEMLGAMREDPRCLIAVIAFDDHRYVQFWVTSDGEIFAEVISNVNIQHIEGAAILTQQDEEMLRAMGWREPGSTSQPNWRFVARDEMGFIRLVAMIHDTVLLVLRDTRSHGVSMRTWSHVEIDCAYCRDAHRPYEGDALSA